MELENTQKNTEATNSISVEEALALFSKDPIGFINEVVSGLIDYHSGSLTEQMALQNALLIAQKTIPEFKQFEPYILKELADLITNDEDGVLDPWPVMIDRAVTAFKKRFSQMVEQDPGLTAQWLNQENSIENRSAKPTGIEPNGARTQPAVQPQFTRKAISQMSMEEFLANESAINQALKERRVK
jgi:hypothetical protein